MNKYKAVYLGKTIGEHEELKDACRDIWDRVRKDFEEKSGISLQLLETFVWVEGPSIIRVSRSAIGQSKHAEHSTSEKALRYYQEKPSRATRSIGDTIDATAAVAAHDRGKQVWMFYDMRDYSYEQGWIDENTHEFITV